MLHPARTPIRLRAYPVAVLCVAFALSGAAAVLFEALWLSQAGLVFGNSVTSSTCVLAAFMAGLGLGSHFGGRYAGTPAAARRAVALLQASAALTGIALVFGLGILGPVFARLATPFAGSAWAVDTLRFVAAGFLLGVPSVAMGMTFPLVVAAVQTSPAAFGAHLGWLYGANTLGGVLGVLSLETFLLPLLGVRKTSLVAGALLAAAAVIAFALARVAPPPVLEAQPAPVTKTLRRTQGGPKPARIYPWLLATFAAGFSVLGFQIVWLRFLSLFLDDSPALFSAVLTLVLAGIAAGGVAGALWLAASPGVTGHAPRFAYACGVTALGGYLLFPYVLQGAWAPGASYQMALSIGLPLALPVSIGSGLFFTVLGAEIRQEMRSDPSAAGALSLANTAGSAAGALVTGLFLVPRWGMERALFGLIALYAVSGAALSARRKRPSARRLVELGVFLVALSLFPFGRVSGALVPGSAARWMTNGDQLVLAREGLTGTILHVRHRLAGEPLYDQFAANAYSMSSNHFSARRYMSLFALIPRVLHPGVQRALLLCYGMGNTAEALEGDPGVRSIDVVDVSADMLELSRGILPRREREPLDDPRVRVHIEDARYFLQATSGTYDLITGEPPPPIIQGVASLYSREYFELLRSRLAPEGVVTYWLPTMDIGLEAARGIAGAFCDAFEDCSLWHGSDENFVLLGTNGSERGVSDAHFCEPWHGGRSREFLAGIGLEYPGQLGALFIGDAAFLRDFAASTKPLIDDFPRIAKRDPSTDSHAEYVRAFRDTRAARTRFAKSEWVKLHVPEGARGESLRHFENQRLIDDLLFPGPSAARQTGVLEQVLFGTPLKFPVFLLQGSDPDAQRVLASAPPAAAVGPVLAPHRVAAALSRRDFRGALSEVRASPNASSIAGLESYLEAVVARGGPLEEP